MTGIYAEVFQPEAANWKSIKRAVARIERQLFGDQGWDAKFLGQEFLEPRNIAVILRDGDTVIGYTWASPVEDMEPEVDRSADTGIVAYIANTAIKKEYHGRHLIGIMMEVLEDALRGKGYKFMERDTAVANGYADNVVKAYGEKICEHSEPHDSEWGPQVFFKIAL